MTGPRSKGCISCVQRRVKCDEEQPRCRRCAKANIVCKGYARPLTIVSENTRVVRGARALTRKNGAVEPQDSASRLVAFSFMKRNAMSRRPPEPLKIVPSWLTEDVFMGFLLDKLSSGHDSRDQESNWSLVRDASTSVCILSFGALAEMFFGKSHGLPQITMKATAKYSLAIRALAEEIDNSNEPSIFTLSAMTALSMYELIAFTTSNAWVEHGKGVSKYMYMLGPQTFRKKPAKTIFEHNRVMLISRAIMCRERTYLSQDEWKTVPWKDDPHSKTSADNLMDIVSAVADLLAGFDALQSFKRDVTRVYIELEALVERVKQNFAALDSWWYSWYPANSHKCWRVPVDAASTLCLDHSGLFFHERFEFDAFWTCYALMCYDAVRLLLLQTHQDLSKRYGIDWVLTESQISDGGHLRGICNDGEALVREVFECLDFCDRQSRSFASTFCVMFPMFVVANHVELNTRESEWMCKASKIEKDRLIGYVTVAGRVSVQRLGSGDDNKNNEADIDCNPRYL